MPVRIYSTVGKSSRYVTSHPGQLSLAIPPWRIQAQTIVNFTRLPCLAQNVHFAYYAAVLISCITGVPVSVRPSLYVPCELFTRKLKGVQKPN